MPHDLPLLNDLLILLLASVPIAFLCHKLRMPVIVGFMLTGVLIGPYGLKLISDVHAVETLAEIGVMLLLFTIGLEFSLSRLMEIKRLVLGGGGLQTALTTAAGLGIFFLLGWPFKQAVLFGFLLALSSTAIVMKTYSDRLETDTPHGRAGIGILLFQDLCIVPMMLLVPILSGREVASAKHIAVKLGTAVAAVAAIIFASRKLIPFLLGHIVRLRSQEVFIIFVVLVSFGTSWLTAQFGLSLALGAFVAGVVLSESEYSHQIVADILPFRDVFNSLFFISIGMLLSTGFFLTHLPMVAAWFAGLVVVKAAIIVAVILLLGYPLRVAVMAAVGLAQIGEFSFILAKTATSQNLLSEGDYQLFLASAILSMVAAPFFIKAAGRIGYAAQSLFAPGAPPPEANDAFAEPKTGCHVVIVGYGLNGRNLAKVLHRTGIPYQVLEMNAQTISEARAQGVPIFYGDAVRREVLHHIGVPQAKILVIAISDPAATRHTVSQARELNPRLHIIVRTRYMSELPELYRLGANQVVPEEFETSIEIFSRVLAEFGVTRNVIQREIEDIRREGYQMLRGASLPLAELGNIADAFDGVASDLLFISADSHAVGRTLGELDLRNRTGATISSAVRHGNTMINLGPDFSIQAEDILVLMGEEAQIEAAIACLKNGAAPLIDAAMRQS
ncbi:MAG TPA: cation:proton antiporter [Blastocatellia bacterium]|nr:cation:proton antiporter [Blastocatellia bacterium]HMV85740.1 cation:proton antiporter [Blastocatellia bacterium]HMX26782.1 cation:proton antiporter [Blastocatellia bacterium]HNG32449.1 cation:proton antiporter [Blastocatellia bacterium]